jgi:AcrR family transcriptional regulator
VNKHFLLFYRHGIRAVGVEAIAEAAGTNKMTLYRHFASKDELVAEYLRQSAQKAEGCWERFTLGHPGDPRAQLGAWLEEMAGHLAEPDERGCALANAAIELPDKDHPARRVIEDYKRAHRTRLVELSAAAGLSEPECWPTSCTCSSKAPASWRRASAQRDLQRGCCTWAKP